jgi:predicted MPP superfamily phosphohydrolase
MKNITWLHLSDWHQKGQDFDRGVVRDALIKDIRDRERIDPSLAHVDFVVFSGDLAFSGEPAEYEAARQHFLDPVMSAVGLDPNRMFIVPGNHDLNRETVYEMLPPELQKPLNSDVLVQKWLNDQKRERTLEPFEAFRKFVSEYTGQPTPDYASIVRLEAGGTQVALLGLNSAWMTARNKDLNNEINDYGFTLIGEPQLHSALEQIAEAELRIAVLHHPFDWLNEFDRNRTEARLGRECHFILRGHTHNQQVSVMRGTGGECVIIPAGASYKRRIAEDPRYTNAYNWVHLDLDVGYGAVYLRRWSDPRNKWIEDTDAYDDGKFALDKLPKEVGKKKLMPPSNPQRL